jgi:hypothetical protein
MYDLSQVLHVSWYLVYAAFVIILRSVMAFASGLLVYYIGASKCYLSICMFEKVMNFLTLALWLVKVTHFLLWLCMFLAVHV